ncbi:hypothetical protein [Glutamicibacter protophormiae]|uniref:Uncharacterized protein n=1 Tax=Glutamicibacter protophormiae TaxID=37930 RepID=A0ABS4XN04_GLUPR|nr:hypothetical protein [Glutamicibacter protophormiae]MBP2397893.1 hypothetical protein [Glutamicibacter protophormiae]QRQ78606.1 hypothetical protein JQN66_17225 [Glutamicibacter protophormiae]WPR64675.1 hypothetical protein SLW72_17575 [Glutamicibacter protophormiae]WPR68170.1 hypothetical protein SLW73_17570 [Glutamicibacter protophormiae]GGL85814.1 hypothetical protein GCM10010038_14670 [Glutamicibacter protophormiae]
MKNYIRPVLTLLCVVAAAVTYFAFNNILIALLFAACGVMLWAFFGKENDPSVEITKKVDPKELKEYRRQNPEASISDAIRATQP